MEVDEQYKKWDISKGDYERHFDNPLHYTESYKTKIKIKKITKIIIGSVIAIAVIGIVIAALA